MENAEPMTESIQETVEAVRAKLRKTGTHDAIGSMELDSQDTENSVVASVSATGTDAISLLKARALRRIEESRRVYGAGASPSPIAPAIKAPVPARKPETPPQSAPETAGEERRKGTGDITPPGRLKPGIRLVHSPQRTESSGVVTRELKKPPVEPTGDKEPKKEERKRLRLVEEPVENHPLQPELIETSPQELEIEEVEIEEFDEESDISDLAPLGQRFNAGLFDILICAFASLAFVSPYIAFGGEILSSTGIVLFVAMFGVTSFLYQAISLGIRGKTFGMKLFALELIDIEENQYPTFMQAAGNAFLFVLTLLTLGLGFTTMLFSPEKRAVHDFLSGTLMVREY